MIHSTERRKVIFIITFVVYSFGICAQPLSTNSKKAIQLYDMATSSIDRYNYNQAVTILHEAVKIDAQFIEAWLLMADAYDFMNKYDSVVYASENALKVGGEKYPIIFFFCAQAYYRTGEYSKALDKANIFLQKKKYTPNQLEAVKKLIRDCEFALNAIKNPLPFKIKNMGDSINSEYDEYWPGLSADEKTIVFTRLIPREAPTNQFFGNWQEDIFFSTRTDSIWSKARSISNQINTMQNEGAESITADGLKIYYTACNRNDGKGRCDIYYSERSSEGWSKGINIGGPVNTEYNEKQPSLSADGRTLYFVSNRPGGKGKYDIWVSHLQDNGLWTEPSNLGDSINTPDDEQSPFIHPNNRSLYFSSDGWPGMGGYDIFVATKKFPCDTCWSVPKNLGYPINTCNDEIGFIVNARGTMAYYASDRDYAHKRDIYEFELPPQVRPLPVSYMKGVVFDAETYVPLDATFELIDLSNYQTIYRSVSQKNTGEFLVCLPIAHEYALNVSKENYLFYSEHFTLFDTTEIVKPVVKNIALQPIKTGKTVVLNNIFFETNSFELKKSSEVELTKLISFLQKYPDIKIEISGHTDNTGNEKFNLTLSENRAKVVAQYLISHGIDSKRIRYKGYGEKMPVADNNTEEGRSKNRRTEFQIVE
jgi:outer membrane protein OmpA-like peptidoglycan-associated protein